MCLTRGVLGRRVLELLRTTLPAAVGVTITGWFGVDDAADAVVLPLQIAVDAPCPCGGVVVRAVRAVRVGAAITERL